MNKGDTIRVEILRLTNSLPNGMRQDVSEVEYIMGGVLMDYESKKITKIQYDNFHSLLEIFIKRDKSHQLVNV